MGCVANKERSTDVLDKFDAAKHLIEAWPEKTMLLEECTLPAHPKLLHLNGRLEHRSLGDVIQCLVSQGQQGNVVKLDAERNNITCIQASELRQLPNLRALHLKHNRVLSGAMLTQCPLLIHLDVSCNGLTDASLAAWPHLPSLHLLRIGANHITDLTLLERFPNLHKLFIYELPIRSLSTLPRFLHLTHLDVDCATVQTWAGMPSLPSLKWLLARENGFDTLEGMPELPRLQYMFMAGNRLTTLECLPVMPCLEQLVLSNNNIMDLTGVENAPHLDEVVLDDNPLTPEALCALKDLQQLSVVSLCGSIGSDRKQEALAQLPDTISTLTC